MSHELNKFTSNVSVVCVCILNVQFITVAVRRACAKSCCSCFRDFVSTVTSNDSDKSDKTLIDVCTLLIYVDMSAYCLVFK